MTPAEIKIRAKRVAAVLAVYAATCAFVTWGEHPGMWSIPGRLFAAFFALIFGAFAWLAPLDWEDL